MLLVVAAASLALVALTPATSAWAAITAHTDWTRVWQGSGGAHSWTIDKPAGTVEGDVLVAVWDWGGSEAYVSFTGGWTSVLTTPATAGQRNQKLFYRVATDSEPANYTFNVHDNTTAGGVIMRFSGVDTLTPITLVDGVGRSQNAAAYSSSSGTVTVTAPSLATPAAHDYMLFAAYCGFNAADGRFGPLSDGMLSGPYVNQGGQNGRPNMKTGYQPWAGGDTGVRTTTWRSSSTNGWIAQLVALNAAASNAAPVAVADTYSTAEDAALNVTASGVLGNDSDPDGPLPLQASLVTGPSNGVLVLGANGSVLYTPNANYNGPDSFTYQAYDGAAAYSNTVSVSITVTPANDAPVAHTVVTSTSEDTTKAVTMDGTDVDGDPLIYEIVDDPADGWLTDLSGSSVTYHPNPNFHGGDSFTYRVKDTSNAYSGPATVNITINSVNDPPDPGGWYSESLEGLSMGPLSVSGSDVDGDVVSYSGLTSADAPAGIIMNLTPTGSFSFTPPADWNGDFHFSWTADDGHGGTATGFGHAIVHQVNDAPTANTDAASVNEDAASGVLVSVLANDSKGPPDEASQELTITAVTQGANGSVAIVGGQVRYTPAANYNGPDSFTYTVRDNGQTNSIFPFDDFKSDTGTVNITVDAVNDAPSFTKGEDVTVAEDSGPHIFTVWATNISLGPADESGQARNFIVTNDNHALFSTQPAITADGDLTFTLAADAFGSATVSVSLHDNGGNANGGVDTSPEQTFSITVTPANDAPVAHGVVTSTAEDTTKAVTMDGTDVDGDPLIYEIVDDPADGWLTDLSGSSVTYHPNPNFHGGDSFTYRVKDTSNAYSGPATVNITINSVNDPPDPGGWYSESLEGLSMGPLSVSGSDVDGDVVSYSGLTSADAPAGIIMNLTPTGSFSFTPPADWNGDFHFSWTADDGHGGTATGFGHAIVHQVNDAPTANTDAASVNEDAASGVLVSVLANDSKGPPDEASQELTITAVTQGANGSVAIVGGQVRYTPAANYNGPDSFTYTVRDNGQTNSIFPFDDFKSDTGTVNITVDAVNDAPSFTKGEDVTVAEDSGPHIFTVWATNISLGPADESGQARNFIVTNDNHALFSTQPAITADGDLTFTLAADAFGSATVSVSLHDNGGNANGGVDTSPEQTFSITVTPANQPPVASDDTTSTLEDTAKTVYVLANDTDVDGDLLVVIGAGPSSHGIVDYSAGSFITYTPEADYFGPDSFDYLIWDGKLTPGGYDVGTVHVTVSPVNDAPSFTRGGNQTVAEDSGAQTVPGWATDISAGPANESGQALHFDVQNDNDALFAAQPAVSPGGTLTYTPAANAFGSATVTVSAHDNGGTADGGVETSAARTFTLNVTPVNDPPVISVSPSLQTVQYSDEISQMHAWGSDVDNDLAITYTPDPMWTALEDTEDFSGPTKHVWVDGQIMQAPGDYPCTFSLDDGQYLRSASSVVRVTKETASVSIGTQSSPVVAGSGGTAAPTINGRIYQENDGSPGNLSLAIVHVRLVPIGPGPSYERTVTGSEILRDGCFAVRFPGVAVNTYRVLAWADGAFTSPTRNSQLVVFARGESRARGSGSFYWPGTNDRTTFTLDTKYGGGGGGMPIFGSLTMVRHTRTGDFELKSHILSGLSVSAATGGPFGWAVLTGTADLARPTGVPYPDCTFVLYVEDGNAPGAGADRFWISVKDHGSTVGAVTIGEPATGTAATVRGDVVIPHRATGSITSTTRAK